MLVSQLSESIAYNIEDIKVLEKLYGDKYSVFETDSNPNTDLRRVDIVNLPGKNIWCFQSEIQDIECLRNQNHTVERTILHLNGSRLYAYMIELKSSLSKKNIGELKKKFTCSLVTLTLYLANHPDFSSLTEVEIFPVGVVCFNSNIYQINQDFSDKHSSLHKVVSRFNPQQDFHQTNVRLEPLTLGPIGAPVLFFQNPDWMPTPPNMTNEFTIDFNRFSV